MTTPQPPQSVATAADLDAARLLLTRLGVSPVDLLTTPQEREPAPTFAEYIPTVSAAVTDATRRVYGTYWNHILEQWANRRLDEPTPSEIKQLMEYVRTHVVVRRNARGGRSAAEHFIAAFRCLYQHAENDATSA
jgi:integrase/recombinase XerC